MLWEGHDAAYWQRAWRAGEVRLLASTPSTNDVVAGMAAAGAPDFSIALAETQSRGRGRGGSTWNAPPASSLLFSVLLRQHEATAAAACAPIRIGLAVAEAIGGAGLKWPNDIVFAGKGKVAGILCEGVFGSHIVAGIGINVYQNPDDFPAEMRGSACSILSATGQRIDRAELLGRVLGALRVLGPAIAEPLADDELARFASRDVLLDQHVTIAEGERTLHGIARGLAPDGALLLESAHSLTRVYNGTVRLREAGAYPGSQGAT